MGLTDILLIGAGLAMDAAAVSMTNGMVYKNLNKLTYISMPVFFGVFQMLMPVMGYYAGGLFAEIMTRYSGIVIFVILGIIGAKMIKEGVEQEIAWGHYVIGDDISGLNCQMITDYIRYLGNLRCMNLGFEPLYPGYEKEPDSMSWISQYSNANLIKTDFFEARSSAYAKSSALEDDL